MTPTEYVATAVALLTMFSGGLAYWIKLETRPLHHTAAKLDHLIDRIEKLADTEEAHRQAGATWANAVYRHLVDHGHKSPPNPADYPGI